MTTDAFVLAPGAQPALGTAPAGGRGLGLPLERLPAILSPDPLDPASALGSLFAAEAPDRDLGTTRELLGPWAPALGLLTTRERMRVTVVASWIVALAANAREGDRPEKRIERLNRSAFRLARALAGEPVDSPFARRFAVESAARALPRRALDLLLAESRQAVLCTRDLSPEEWEARTAAIAGAACEAILGQEPTAATVDAATALLRLGRLTRLPQQLAAGCVELPSAPRDAKSANDPVHASALVVAAIAAETLAIRQQLLRGARSLAEVPLGYRRALAFLIASGLDLLGRIEVHPEALLTAAPQVRWWRRQLALWRARRQPLD